MVTYRKVSLEESVVSDLQEISRIASVKENRTVTLSELVRVGLGHARTVFTDDSRDADTVTESLS